MVYWVQMLQAWGRGCSFGHLAPVWKRPICNPISLGNSSFAELLLSDQDMYPIKPSTLPILYHRWPNMNPLPFPVAHCAKSTSLRIMLLALAANSVCATARTLLAFAYRKSTQHDDKRVYHVQTIHKYFFSGPNRISFDSLFLNTFTPFISSGHGWQ